MKNTSRINIADILRGFSIMLILFLYAVKHFNFYSFPEVTSERQELTDKYVWNSLFFVFHGKVYGIFAILFGFSFFIQDNNQFKKGNNILNKLIPYGRMSLINYITQSVIGAILFYYWRFALHNKLNITEFFVLGIVLFIIQYTFCLLWLKNNEQDSLEYIWKKATWIKI